MRISALVLCLAASSAWAQPTLSPSAASTRLYFAQLADGGTASQKWTTSLLFVNPSTVYAASIAVSFYGDNGQPLALDFGQGAKSTLTVNLPIGGSTSVTSTGASADTAIGWALATSNTPVLGTVVYRWIQNGTPVLDVAASGSGSTYYYSSFANPNLGIALVNPSTTQSVHLLLTAKDQGGTGGGVKTITLAANGHTAFNLGQQISGLAASFTGSVTITSSDNPPLPFVAWTLNSRDNLLTALPAGEMQGPPPYDRRVYDAFARINAVAGPLLQEIAQDPKNLVSTTPAQVLQIMNSMGLAIDAGTTMNATFQTSDRKVHITQAMLEALGSNEPALAFLIIRTEVIGFVALTGIQPDIGIAGITDNNLKTEITAEVWGLMSLMKAGYDPGGAMDCITRVWAAYSEGVTVDSALLGAFTIPSGVSLRLQYLTEALQGVCGTTSGTAVDCVAVHNLWHPHFPSQLP